MKGWVDLGYLAMHRPGVELTIFQNHESDALTTTLQSHLLCGSLLFLRCFEQWAWLNTASQVDHIASCITPSTFNYLAQCDVIPGCMACKTHQFFDSSSHKHCLYSCEEWPVWVVLGGLVKYQDGIVTIQLLTLVTWSHKFAQLSHLPVVKLLLMLYEA